MSGGRRVAAPLTPVLPTYRTDVARNKTPTGLATGGAWSSLSAATDGDETTFASTNTVSMPQWLRVDLGSAQTITAFRLTTNATGNRLASGTIESSADDSTWTAAYTFSGNALADTGMVTITARTARYWRAYCTATGSPGSTGLNVAVFSLYAEVAYTPGSGRTFNAPDDTAARPTHANGDDFDGAALSAAWTQRNLAAGHVTFPAADPGVRLILDAQGDGIWRPCPSGDFEVVAGFRGLSWGYSASMVGLAILDGSGNGVGCSQYNNAVQFYMWSIVGYVYSGSGVSMTPTTDDQHRSGRLMYMSLRKTGNNYTGRYSLDGTTWSAFSANQAWSGTPTQLGIGRFFNAAGSTDIEVTRLNVYPSPTYYA